MSGEVIRESASVGLLKSRAIEGRPVSYCPVFLEPSDLGSLSGLEHMYRRHPTTGDTIKIPAKTVLEFVVAKAAKEASPSIFTQPR